MDYYEHERRNREGNGSSSPAVKRSKQYTPGCFVASLQPLWEEGEGIATNLELRPCRNSEPGQPQRSTAFCSTAQAQAEVESPSPRVGIVGILPSTSTHPNTGCPTLNLCTSCDVWGLQRPEFWQTGAFCSPALESDATWTCVIGSPILCHLCPPIIQGNPVYHCLIPVSKAGNWAADRLQMSNHISYSTTEKLWKNQSQSLRIRTWNFTGMVEGNCCLLLLFMTWFSPREKVIFMWILGEFIQ